ncbi:hypothetical protein Mal15_48560 [Stieleria maiorica]|uniref:EF-hand domain-containing protein n=1 Tax=Stieleria maiorica TaxID=2795974 RepID=A0A5B9MIN4_9BACT|nr:hypothetical protein [Stieleria maiorica]QEG00784.1 hypothetical protein Mal15_48560 [Stieleria maiorica]
MIRSAASKFLACCIVATFLSGGGAFRGCLADDLRLCLIDAADRDAAADDLSVSLVRSFSRCGFSVVRESVPRRLARQAMSAERFVIYVRGHVAISEADCHLHTDQTGTTVSLGEIVRLLNRVDPPPKHVIIVGDLKSDTDAAELYTCLSTLVSRSAVPIDFVAPLTSGDDQDVGRSAMETLHRATTSLRLPDADGNGELSVGELVRFFVAESGSPERILSVASPTSSDNRTVIRYQTADLEHALEDIADEVARYCHHASIDHVVVLPFLLAAGNEVRSSQLGRYLSDRVRRHLVYKHHLDACPEEREVIETLRTSRIRTREIVRRAGEVSQALLPESQDRGVVVFGRIGGLVPSGADFTGIHGLQLRLVTLSHGKPQRALQLDVDSIRLKPGHSDMVSPRQRIAMSRLEGLNDDSLAVHPMTDPSFRPRIYLAVDGKRVDHEYINQDSRMSVRVDPNTSYEIVVDNQGGEAFFLRLLVDGKNTIPERPYDNSFGSSTERRPGILVSLPEARCWYVAKNAIHTFKGFYNDVDSGSGQAVAYGFRVTDQLDDDAYDNLDTGVITAAIYKPVAKSRSSMGAIPQFATELGQRIEAPIAPYQGEQAPQDEPSDIVYIDYGF